jgi:delta 1-pyrroline-5-carboxylate dehydrogenase
MPPDRRNENQMLQGLKSNRSTSAGIDGKEIRTDKKVKITAPHDHNLLLGYAYHGGKKETELAIESAMRAHKTWAAMPKHHGRDFSLAGICWLTLSLIVAATMHSVRTPGKCRRLRVGRFFPL